jgi:thiamine biosynthesis lipoprotein
VIAARQRAPSVKRSVIAMSTLVSVETVVHTSEPDRDHAVVQAVDRAFAWFERVESACSRFDPSSEVSLLSRHPGEPMPASTILREAVRFALAVAEASGGAFDPTLGAELAGRGFDVSYRTGTPVPWPARLDPAATYRDVEVDDAAGTITLHRPLWLDLGAVAKGLAIDLAAREVALCDGFAIDAGGDVLVGGTNAAGEAWSLGIRHPRRPGEIIERLHLTDGALCTSGDYERPALERSGGHHILDPRTRRAVGGVTSVSVIAPTAIVADALATAAFVLGPASGVTWLEQQGVRGVMFSETLARTATAGW